jgi:glutamate racemase
MHVQKGGIAFFDSGIGGLTVLAECQKYLKSHILYYYGDNARAPYGNLSHSVMWSYVKEAFDLFADLQVKAAVVACNTVTALCIENLRKNYSFPIIGAEPAIMQAARQTEGEVLILATKGTLESERFRLLYQK